MIKARVALVFVLVAVLMVGCARPHKVKKAVLRDTLFSVEETNNGNFRVFFTHDDVAGYCTADKELGALALTLLHEHDGEVIANFRDLNINDPEDSWWSKSDCGTILTGSESSMAMFLLEGLEVAPHRAGDEGVQVEQ